MNYCYSIKSSLQTIGTLDIIQVPTYYLPTKKNNDLKNRKLQCITMYNII